MNCDHCSRNLVQKESYATLVVNKGIHIFTFTYCDAMCIALDWQCIES
jgi:hypothetical protein